MQAASVQSAKMARTLAATKRFGSRGRNSILMRFCGRAKLGPNNKKAP
jgi:hypothetical protein